MWVYCILDYRLCLKHRLRRNSRFSSNFENTSTSVVPAFFSHWLNHWYVPHFLNWFASFFNKDVYILEKFYKGSSDLKHFFVSFTSMNKMWQNNIYIHIYIISIYSHILIVISMTVPQYMCFKTLHYTWICTKLLLLVIIAKYTFEIFHILNWFCNLDLGIYIRYWESCNLLVVLTQ